MSSPLRNYQFWIVIVALVSTTILMSAVGTNLLNLQFEVAGESFQHWLTWAGTSYIAVFTPIYYFIKRRYTANIKTILAVHMFGNLLAFALVSIHFAHQITRPLEAYPDLATGIVLYPAVLIIVLSGVFTRFAPGAKRVWRFLHRSGTLVFYLIVMVHVLHGLEII